jgi:hypothetical protein
MPAEAQSATPPNAAASIEAAIQEQARLRATLSPEEYEQWRQQRVVELIELTKRSGAYAEAQGMTDEIFEQLLADEE